MGLTLFKTTSENAWLSLWQGIWTSAGASSMSVESAVTQVSADQSATGSATIHHLIWQYHSNWNCPVDFVIFEIVPLMWSPLKEEGRLRLCRQYYGRCQPEENLCNCNVFGTNQNNAYVFHQGGSKPTRRISFSQDYYKILVKLCILSQFVFCKL